MSREKRNPEKTNFPLLTRVEIKINRSGGAESVCNKSANSNFNLLVTVQSFNIYERINTFQQKSL